MFCQGRCIQSYKSSYRSISINLLSPTEQKICEEIKKREVTSKFLKNEILKHRNHCTLDFLISVDPQISIDSGKIPQIYKRRPPNKHRPWKILTNSSPSKKGDPEKVHQNKKSQ